MLRGFDIRNVKPGKFTEGTTMKNGSEREMVRLGGYVDRELVEEIEREMKESGFVGDRAAFTRELIQKALEERARRKGR